MKKTILIVIFCYSSLFGEGWIGKFIENVDIDSFVKSIKFDGTVKTCQVKNAKDSLLGFNLHHEDVFLFSETVRRKGYIMLLDSNILEKKNSSSTKLKNIAGTGKNRKKRKKLYINIIQLPIFSLIGSALGADGIFCFHPKGRSFFYSSAIDPTSNDYMQYYTLIDTLSMFTTNGILSMIFDCLAYNGLARTDSYSTTGKYFSTIIDSYQHSFGCNGGVAIGGTTQNDKSALVNGMLTSATMLKILSRTGYVILQSKNSKLNIGDVTCKQRKGPFIKTQFVPQMIVPVPGKQKELGISPAEWAEFHDNHTSKGNTVIAWWVRKDFVSMSGKCIW